MEDHTALRRAGEPCRDGSGGILDRSRVDVIFLITAEGEERGTMFMALVPTVIFFKIGFSTSMIYPGSIFDYRINWDKQHSRVAG